MSIIQHYQLARDSDVTVANLADELVRRKGNCEVAVHESGVFHLSDLHDEVCSIDTFLRQAIALRPGQPIAFIVAIIESVSIGFSLLSAQEALRFR